MVGIKKFVMSLGLLSAFAVCTGCTTTETRTITQSSSAATASAGAVAVSVSSETTTVSQTTTPPPPPPQTDILAGAKKPCSTVAPDAPKFVDPETK